MSTTNNDAETDADIVYKKSVETAKAQAAIAGFELIEHSDGSFLIKRFGVHRELPHLAAVHRFLSVSSSRLATLAEEQLR